MSPAAPDHAASRAELEYPRSRGWQSQRPRAPGGLNKHVVVEGTSRPPTAGRIRGPPGAVLKCGPWRTAEIPPPDHPPQGACPRASRRRRAAAEGSSLPPFRHQIHDGGCGSYAEPER
eukprot:6801155-Pyramimonas_sp.AAC.1